MPTGRGAGLADLPADTIESLLASLAAEETRRRGSIRRTMPVDFSKKRPFFLGEE